MNRWGVAALQELKVVQARKQDVPRIQCDYTSRLPENGGTHVRGKTGIGSIRKHRRNGENGTPQKFPGAEQSPIEESETSRKRHRRAERAERPDGAGTGRSSRKQLTAAQAAQAWGRRPMEG